MSKKKSHGRSLLKMLLAILLLIGLAIISHLISHRHSNQDQASSSTTTSTSTTSTPGSATAAPSYTTLSPATVPSKTAECSTPISFQSNGNSGPITCSNGDLNVTEWNSLSGLEPTVMSLGYNATFAQVQSALCTDANASNSDANTTNSRVIESTVYNITALYYGWSFSSNPSTILTDGGC